jgi:ribA/ribD-fused uncharacterized protein
MMPKDDQMRSYVKRDVVFFRTTTGEFGPLSNMAPHFSIFLLGTRIQTAEALYQACRFPDDPEIQRIIIDQPSPMTAKMKSKKYRTHTRTDWDSVRVSVMRWCLRAKLSQNWVRLGAVLEKTKDTPIVEESTKDDFWGAKPQDDGTLRGRNVLGRLLMELRQEYRAVEEGRLEGLKFPSIAQFRLFGTPLEQIATRGDKHQEFQSTMFK